LGKLIFLFVVGLIAWWLLKGLFKAKGAEPPASTTARGEDMVACARCGVNMPRSDAREDSGRFYCVNNPHCHS
jgi:uncharacterized protein